MPGLWLGSSPDLPFFNVYHQDSGSQLEAPLSFSGQLETSGDTFGFYHWKKTPGILGVAAKDHAKCPTIPSTAPTTRK